MDAAVLFLGGFLFFNGGGFAPFLFGVSVPASCLCAVLCVS
jgi:hypothetical protein